MGVVRLNVGSGVHVARDYGDETALYVDTDTPDVSTEHPRFPEVRVLAGNYKFLIRDALELPLEDHSIGEIYCEHLIEHVTPKSGLKLCAEFRRVLRPGGTLRISTPDLAWFVDLYTGARASDRGARSLQLRELRSVDPSMANYCLESNAGDWQPSSAFLLNHVFRLWGHEWIYDSEELRRLLIDAGFDCEAIARRTFRDGAIEALAQLDQEYRRDESLILEATAP